MLDRGALLLWLPCCSCIVALALWFFFGRAPRENGRGGDSSGLSGKKLEELALKFEDQKLSGAAARAWTEYLESARHGDEDAARIWFRIGKLYQDGGDNERALEAYYRSEALAKIDELEPEISKRTAECLEALGKFAALNYELESRTAVAKSDSTGGKDVLAEVGTWKITRGDLDQMIEAEIDMQLRQLAGSLTPDERRAQKQRLLDEVLKQGERDKWLQRFIAEEMLYRRAREEKLMDDPGYQALTRNLERKILAQKYLDQRVREGDSDQARGRQGLLRRPQGRVQEGRERAGVRAGQERGLRRGADAEGDGDPAASPRRAQGSLQRRAPYVKAWREIRLIDCEIYSGK